MIRFSAGGHRLGTPSVADRSGVCPVDGRRDAGACTGKCCSSFFSVYCILVILFVSLKKKEYNILGDGQCVSRIGNSSRHHCASTFSFTEC